MTTAIASVSGIFRSLEELDLPASHNVNSRVRECPQSAENVERGDEIIGHGRTNSERQDNFPKMRSAS